MTEPLLSRADGRKADDAVPMVVLLDELICADMLFGDVIAVLVAAAVGEVTDEMVPLVGKVGLMVIPFAVGLVVAAVVVVVVVVGFVMFVVVRAEFGVSGLTLLLLLAAMSLLALVGEVGERGNSPTVVVVAVVAAVGDCANGSSACMVPSSLLIRVRSSICANLLRSFSCSRTFCRTRKSGNNSSGNMKNMIRDSSVPANIFLCVESYNRHRNFFE